MSDSHHISQIDLSSTDISFRPAPLRPGRILVVGAAVLDRIYYVEHLPRPGETAIGSRTEVHSGGKGANQALAARKMDADVRFLSAVGDDEAGEMVLKPLRDAGVNTETVAIIPGVATAEASISVDVRGENQITACPGAYHQLTPEMIATSHEAFEWAQVLLIQNELPRATVDAAIKLAKEVGLKIIFNPAPFRPNSPPPPRDLYAIIPNEIEAAGLLGQPDYFGLTPRERTARWTGFGAEHVIVTLGRNGGEWYDPFGHRRAFEVEAETPVDSVGAGDAFCGILTALLAEGMDMDKAIRVAHSGASISVTKRGAQEGLPSREELAEYLKKHPKDVTLRP
ncbi:ribokinase [bacterium]|nr:ribokinase [bacterium]